MNALIVFAKNPLTEQVKTRLAKDIGEEKARNIYKQLLDTIIKEHTGREYDLIVSVKGNTGYFFDVNVISQPSNDLGENIYGAFSSQFPKYQKIIISGSDIPELTHELIQQAFSLLDGHDVVLGPSTDGGYNVVGLHDLHNIFTLKKWSHEHVLRDTLRIIEEKGLSYALLEESRDIDTVDDLKFYPDYGV